MSSNEKTLLLNTEEIESKLTRERLEIVVDALRERGYNPVAQISGFLISGDPAYITSYKNARNIMHEIDRNCLMEEVVKYYLGK